jgi:hypothetical protein
VAVAGSLLTSNSNATPAATFNTASIAPGANRLVLAAVFGVDAAFTTPPTFSLSGNGLTWVSVLRVVSGAGGPVAFQVFRAMGASPSAGAVTIDADVAALDMAQWSIAEFTGVNTGGTDGSAAVGNTASTTGEGVSTLNVTLPAFGSANNGTYGAFSAGNDIPTTFNFTPGSGFTELAETGIAAFGGAFYFGLQSQWRATNDTGVDVTTPAVTQGEIIGIALEIVAARIAAASDTVTFSDSGVSITQRLSAASDSVSFSDSAISISVRLSIGADTITFSDSSLATTGFPAEAADTITFSDSAVSFTDRLSTAADSLSLSDSAVSITTRLSVAVDTFTPSDSAVAVVSYPSVAADTLSVSDSAVASVTPAGDTFASDTVTFSDSASSFSSILAVGSDTIIFSDSAVVEGDGVGPVQGPGVEWMYKVQGRGVQGTGVPGVLQ